MNKRTDHNQAEIIKGLRAFGATVQDLSQLGKGCPDCLICFRGRNYLIEVKNAADRSPKLTTSEEKWIREWKGEVAVITSIEDAIAVVQDGDYEDTTNQSK